ncbi:glycosyltransferase [Pseudoalteromonas atlantica]|uniref:glycosyltransferase n=1 Tax=Pseudoalteromonas atlantica TaxID=288 RepID=UPI000BBCF08F|nr:glycosyltransferase [Pseudoalteromonas atlantica]
MKTNTKSNKPLFFGHIDSWDGSYLSGWAVNTDNHDICLQIKGDNSLLKTVRPMNERRDLVEQGISKNLNSGFGVDLNAHELFAKGISQLHVIEKGSGVQLQGASLSVSPPEFKGNIDHQSPNKITGWVYDINYPVLNVNIDVYVNGLLVKTIDANLPRLDLKEAKIASFNSGFHIQLEGVIDPERVNRIELKLLGTNIAIFDEIIMATKKVKIDALLQLQNIAKRFALDNSNEKMHWLSQAIIADTIDQARIEAYKPHKVKLSKLDYNLSKNKHAIDIIIPVYRGVDETLNCIKSVLSAKCDISYNLIVINDCSPEPELTKKLKDESKKLSFRLLENELNLGFVGTVNRGMKLSKSNDVLLLNSDTIVTDNWLDKIANAAYTDSTIATVTPFSNNATICSFPKFCADNELSKLVSLNELSSIFANENNREIVDLPTAHGFSMFIKRAALNEVGYFDEQKWGKGYAEENDFSLRAARLGWRNVMATDAFVHHLGAVSFAADSEQFIAKNLEKLNGIYPDYPETVESFVKLDPIRPYRNRVALKLLEKELKGNVKGLIRNSNSILYVSLTIGGGTEVATNDIAALHRKNGNSVFMLTAPSENVWELKSLIDNTFIQYRLPEEETILVKHLKELKVKSVHYHHTIEFPKSVWNIPSLLGVPYEVVLHDYYTICPRVNLVDETQVYCGEPNSSACNRCIKRNGVHGASLLNVDDLGGSVESWRSFFYGKLKGAQKVVTPSNDTRDRILKYFNLRNIEARYHPEPALKYTPKSLQGIKILNVAFIGAIGVHKGLNILKECAQYAYKFDLPIKFTVIGYTADDRYFDELDNVVITGKYDKEDLPSLLEANDCHVAGLFSVWPETYSYTLSESLRAGLHIACFDIGAISERAENKLAIPLHQEKVIVKQLLKEFLS